LIVSALGDFISQIIRKGIAMLLAEQNSVFALKLVHQAYVIEKGKIQWQGSVQELSADEEMRIRYLSISEKPKQRWQSPTWVRQTNR